jgi:hypothetical protein
MLIFVRFHLKQKSEVKKYIYIFFTHRRDLFRFISIQSEKPLQRNRCTLDCPFQLFLLNEKSQLAVCKAVSVHTSLCRSYS